MATSSKSAYPPPAGMMRDRLVEQAISKFMPVVQAANGSEDVSVPADDFAVILGLLKATLPNQASAVEAAYERAIQDAERSHRRNRSKSWVLSCLRDRLRAEIASLSPVATSGSGLPSCVACEDDPKEPNNPCAVCGKCTKPTSGSEAGSVDSGALYQDWLTRNRFPHTNARALAFEYGFRAGCRATPAPSPAGGDDPDDLLERALFANLQAGRVSAGTSNVTTNDGRRTSVSFAVHEPGQMLRLSPDIAAAASIYAAPPKPTLAAGGDVREALAMAISWIEDLPRKNASHQMMDHVLDGLRASLAAPASRPNGKGTPPMTAPPQPARAEAVPTGWKLVPVEPTKEMMLRGLEYTDPMSAQCAADCWAAMLATSPAHPSEADAVAEAAGFKVVGDDGKRWRIVPDEGDWEMQPVGRVTAGEAKVICEGFVGLIRERDRFLRLWNEERDRNASISPAATSGSEAGGEPIGWVKPEQLALIKQGRDVRIWASELDGDVPVFTTPAPSPAGGVREALRAIAEHDVTEIALDPDWPRRIARAALASPASGAGGEDERSA